jgi:hypothetical protein
MSKDNYVKLDKISKHLRFRDTAVDLFKEIKQDTVFDFKNILTISRSFAHEFLTQKNNCKFNISQINASNEINQIFEVVLSNDDRSRFDRNTWQVKRELIL